MGGRGSSGGGTNTSVGGASSGRFEIPSYTKAQIDKLGRSSLETLVTAIYANKAMEQGLSQSEGVYRARALMSGNTTAQLRKYVWKNRK